MTAGTDYQTPLVAGTDYQTPLPTQTGNNGKYLTTNGSAMSWATVDALPSQAGTSGKKLTTNGSAASWGAVDTTPTAYSSNLITSGGVYSYVQTQVSTEKPSQASITLSTSWTGNSSPYTQTVTISGHTITSNSKVDIQPDATAIEQLISDGVQALYIVNNNGTLTAYAVGAVTTASLTLQVVIEEINEEIYFPS